VQLGLSEPEFWYMTFGVFMDLWTAHKQFLGLEKPLLKMSIDDIIPIDIY